MKNQEKALYWDRLQAFCAEERRMPSVREVRDRIIQTRSLRQAKALLDTLVAEGAVLRDAQGRLQPTTEMLGVKKLGVVEAGFPSPAEEEMLDVMTLDEWLVGDRAATFMLEVRGESMRDAGIRPGDIALVERGRPVKAGDIVVAQVDGKWTMKYYRLQRGKVVLMPANPSFSPIYPQEELSIEAVVTAIIRKY